MLARLVLWLVLLGGVAGSAEPQLPSVVVIVHPSRSGAVSREEVRTIYLRQRRFWEDGQPILPVNREYGCEARKVFEDNVFKVSSRINSTWGGNLVDMVRCIKYLEIIREEKLVENAEAMEVLLQNCEDAYGFPPYDALKEFLYLRSGMDLREKEHEIIRKALGTLPATVIRSNTYDWWSRIPTFVNDEQMTTDMARALEVEKEPPRRRRPRGGFANVHV